jgi:hypothetical protein
MISKYALHFILCILSAVTIFHFCIIIKFIPYNITWGGRLKNDNEMYVFEFISILINLFFGLVLLMKGNYIKYKFSEKAINFILWFFIALFLINTLGNVFAKTILEQFFTLITLLLAVLLWLILKKKTT